ncbi:glycosyltransferase [Rubellimicrobium roseum]|uniref:Glycosyltransferase family 2 protein n=1 Tax=Rubellimicrobium roseum TaxID=687525 RepID=A0A5C4NG25_9RHOB|nr:glycosyltransferase family A protein [Rubellimicrobium roseum]TNC71399.1 glycosyltransferase family 2 protein [Rubellimicrobium roseum]
MTAPARDLIALGRGEAAGRTQTASRGASGGHLPTMQVVVPAHQASGEIDYCLAALLRAGFAREEIVVVDDGSTDLTGIRARDWGIRVIQHERPQGPARARNAGVAATRAEIVVFVDSDVQVHPGVRERIGAFFRDHPGHVGLFGSYDDDPPGPAVSRYRNLLHHYVHQTSSPEASTFWTGFGAVRRAEFLAVGGLDPAWAIEDVELGLRLTAEGQRIRLDRDLLCKHLKRWSLRSMFMTDWKVRAVPWARLLGEGRAGIGDLNLSTRHRASGALVVLILQGLLMGLLNPLLLSFAAMFFLAFVAINAEFLRFLLARGGPVFAFRSVLYHIVHYAAADLGYLQVRLGEALLAKRPRLPAAEAPRTDDPREAAARDRRRLASA